jgi:uracil-DNA glycosylase
MARTIHALAKQIEGCEQCPRLRAWCTQVAEEKRAAYREETYWGKPVPGFGDPQAKIFIVGLAPGAHGANRTGRMFSGDRSGDWLYGAMHRAGLANQPTSVGRGDGLELRQAYVTNIVRCAPPDNKPTTGERDACIDYFYEELRLLKQIRVFIALGGFAWDGILRALAAQGHRVKPKPRFGHAAEVQVGPYTLIGSYHPSQQNTFTRRLTEPMFDRVFHLAKKRAECN